MKSLVLAGVFATAALLQAAPPGMPFRESQNFSVTDPRPPLAAPPILHSASGQELVRLDVDVLLLCASRIREALIGELNLPSESAGKIHLSLYRASQPEDMVGLAAARSSDGWDYQLAIPDQIDPFKLVRAIVSAVLLEFANHGQGSKSAEIPLWLVEGASAHVLAVGGSDLVLSAVPTGSMLRVIRERRGLDYLQQSREILRAASGPSFSELAYPRMDQLVGDKLKRYDAGAHLFVYELLHTQNGPANLVAMLRQLPGCWNWETAFLRGFRSEFQTMLDVEKKWSVDLLALTARDPSQVWSKMVCLGRLEDILSAPARVRVSAERVPERKNMSLIELIRSSDFSAQVPVLRQKLMQLQGLRFNANPELVPLIDSYFRVIALYLQKRSQADRTPETRMQGTVSASLVAQEAIRDLEQLDKRRQLLSPEKALSVNSPTSP